MSRRYLFLILVLAISCLDIHQARSIPERARQKFVRRRISPDDPNIEIIEIKEVFYVRRPKKVATPIADDEFDWRIRCDFDPSLPECKDLKKATVAATRPPRSTTTTTPAPTTTTTTTRRTTTTMEPSDASMERKIRCEFNPTAEECAPSITSTTTTTTTTTTEKADIIYDNYYDSDSESGKERETTADTQTEEVEEKEVTEDLSTDYEIVEDGDDEENGEDGKDQEDQEDLGDQEDQEDQEEEERNMVSDVNDGETHSIGALDDGTWN